MIVNHSLPQQSPGAKEDTAGYQQQRDVRDSMSRDPATKWSGIKGRN